MKTVKLVSISDIRTEKTRKDGKVSRKYYVAKFIDATNPFAPARQRNVFQDHNADGTVATWKSGDPSVVSQFVGKEIPGEFVNASVVPYEVNGRTANSFTTIVLSGEKLANVLKQQGMTLATSARAVVETLNVEALNS